MTYQTGTRPCRCDDEGYIVNVVDDDDDDDDDEVYVDNDDDCDVMMMLMMTVMIIMMLTYPASIVTGLPPFGVTVTLPNKHDDD